MIPHISSKPVRVCDKCYDQMSSGQVKPDDPVAHEVTPVQKLKPGKNFLTGVITILKTVTKKVFVCYGIPIYKFTWDVLITLKDSCL